MFSIIGYRFHKDPRYYVIFLRAPKANQDPYFDSIHYPSPFIRVGLGFRVFCHEPQCSVGLSRQSLKRNHCTYLASLHF